MATNRRIITAEGPDFYPTPEWGTFALIEYENFYGPIWEPCCGDGAMSKCFEACGYDVISTDKYYRGYGDVLDFLENEPIKGFTNIVTNPPFNIATEIIEKSLSILPRGGKACFLLRTAFLESKNRYNRLFRTNPPATVYVFSERLSMYPAGQKGVKGGGTTSYSWFVWNEEKMCERNITEVKWIRPGLKNER